MTKKEFISYISINNTGFYKTRKTHIKNIAPTILDEIEQHISKFNLVPINFSDSLRYYINGISTQSICKCCNEPISNTSIYCSNKCKN